MLNLSLENDATETKVTVLKKLQLNVKLTFNEMRVCPNVNWVLFFDEAIRLNFDKARKCIICLTIGGF